MAMSPVGGEHRSAGSFDRGGLCCEHHHRSTSEQPDKAGAVVAGQPRVQRARFGRGVVQPEQVSRGPAKGLSLSAPLAQEAVPVPDRLPPASERDEVRTAALQFTKTQRKKRITRNMWCLCTTSFVTF